MWNKNEKKPIVRYLLLTFAIAWIGLIFLFAGEQTGILTDSTFGVVASFAVVGFVCGMAPAYAMFILLKRSGQIRGVKDFLGRVFKTEKALKTIIITALFCLALLAPNIILNSYIENPWYFFLFFIPAIAVMMVGGGFEEIGWRGFLQPALEEKMHFIPAAFIVGVIWAVWHFPAWLVTNLNQSDFNMLAFSISCITMSFIMAALYKLTRNVFSCVFYHAWSNALGGIFTLDMLTQPPNVKLIVVCAVQITAAIIVYIIAAGKQKKEAGI
ncbi:MAG: CPBP family intramembrane metalloprotease [Oscillospiraceae bacterium]|nr:CPBP family intramembrane metalloprotease [Oscillospiraceae bacterium]